MSLTDRMYQYIAFIRNYFIAPDAGVNRTAYDHISWQLNPVTEISFAGVLILALCLVSVWVNRDKKCSLLAGGWMAWSFLILFVIGWGTAENGLILYALYFGWAFLVLLFQLVEKLEDKLKIRFLVPVVTAVSAVAMAVVNIPAIMEMVEFAIRYYPA